MLRRALSTDQRALGQFTKRAVIDLGPTFIKLGQAASTRSDLYDDAFIAELASLQDEVPTTRFDIPSMIDMDIFDSFDETPFKSASIGQVYRARLKSPPLDVIVKIKRPGIYATMKSDTDNVRDIVTLLERIDPGITGTGGSLVLEETIQHLLEESDYEQEVTNAKRFYENFKDTSWVRVPRVVESACTPDMIVMEYVDAVKLSELPREVNPKKVCEALITSYVIQTMQHGFFHADPHPGNVQFSVEEKALVFYDFGLVLSISKEMRNGVFRALGHVMTRDARAVVNELTSLGVVVPTADASEIEVFFSSIIGYMEDLDLENFQNELMQDELMQQLAKDKPFIVPTFFVYLAKAFAMVEGSLKRLDPEFNYFTYLEPVFQKEVAATIDVEGALLNAAQMPATIKNIGQTVRDLEKSRAAMRRSMKKTRRQIRYAQYSILCTLVAIDQDSVFFAVLALYFITLNRKSQ